ncbi:MAG TPA: trehalose-phosphatase [Caulobacteraceae bacterium]|nr:trehalose-phosphatase [Caulobacteraceae bacterium]
MASALAASSHRLLQAPPPLQLGAAALFADLDGTLAPIRERPDEVGPDAARADLLRRLGGALGGRLAVISGRGLADLDRVLGGGVSAVAAAHGLIRRSAGGEVMATAPALPGPARAALLALGRANPALLVEDKGPAIALHYRAAPQAGPVCEAEAQRLAARFDLSLQKGRMVVDLRARGPSKADAVASFMAEPPFAGATPVFLGDDLTDEDGFAAAQRLGGYGVVVGPRRPTAARYALDDVTATLAWLERSLAPPR